MPQPNQPITYNAASLKADGTPIVPSDFWGGPVIRKADGKLFCPGFVGETFSKNLWDTVVFGGILKTPGVCEVKVTKAQESDVKQARGKDGATVTTAGIMPAQITIAVKIWTPDQLEELRGLWGQIMPKPSQSKDKRPPPIDVYHPTFKTMGIKAVVVLRGEGMIPGGERHTKVFQIDCIEFMSSTKKNATKTHVAAKSNLYDPGRENQGQAAPRPLAGSNQRNKGP